MIYSKLLHFFWWKSFFRGIEKGVPSNCPIAENFMPPLSDAWQPMSVNSWNIKCQYAAPLPVPDVWQKYRIIRSLSVFCYYIRVFAVVAVFRLQREAKGNLRLLPAAVTVENAPFANQSKCALGFWGLFVIASIAWLKIHFPWQLNLIINKKAQQNSFAKQFCKNFLHKGVDFLRNLGYNI